MPLRFLFLLTLLLCLMPKQAQATVGGPSHIEVLGWDPVDRKLFVLEWFHDSSGRLPALGYYLLDEADPRLVQVRSWYRDEEHDVQQTRFWERLEDLRARLQRLEPQEPLGLELRERLESVGPCPGIGELGLSAPCRLLEVELRWQGQQRSLRLHSWGQSDIVSSWSLPQTGHRLVLYSHLGHTHEIGYQQELPLLFAPSSPSHAAPKRALASAGEQESGNP